MLYKRVILVFSIIFIISCKEKNKNDKDLFFKDLKTKEYTNGVIKEISIDSLNYRKIIKFPVSINVESKIKLSEFIDSIKVVKLETRDECIIGDINKMIIENERIFILDTRITKGVYEFDMNGFFIRKYGTHGKGPGEYLYPSDFNINKNELAISDSHRSIILKYDLKGNFKESIRLSHSVSDFSINGSQEDYIFYTPANFVNGIVEEVDDYSLIISDDKGFIKSKSFKIKTKQKFFAYRGKNTFVPKNTFSLFHPRLSNKIYKIHKNNISLLFEIDFGKKSLSEKFDYNITYKELEKKHFNVDSDSFYFDGEYCLTDGILIFKTIRATKIYTSIYSLENEKIKTGNLIYGDIKKGFGSLSPITTYKNYFVGYQHSYNILNNKSFLKSYKDKETIDIVNNIKENDNPLIIFQRLKKI